MEYAQVAESLANELRLKTMPLAVKFLKEKSELPEKSRRPLAHLGKRITLCQAVTMARVYGWTVGTAKEDLICVPAMIAFGFTRAKDQAGTVGKLFCSVGFQRSEDLARKETGSMLFLENKKYEAIVLAPLGKGLFDPDTVVVYGNPAQVMRMVQGYVFQDGDRVPANLGGKVECTEYLVAPFKTGKPRVAIPGMGDRIFSMTQDDEMVFALPGAALQMLVEGIKEAGLKIGARYPITFYQNFQPEFPPMYKTVGDEVGAFSE